MLYKEVFTLIKKEILHELRQKYALNGILLYLGSSVFIGYITYVLGKVPINVPTWNVLFWLILLFAAVNSVAKSFIQESKGLMLYYYTIANPKALILSKIIYNSLLMSLLVVIGYLFFILFLGNPVEDVPFFILTIIVGALGFSASFTMISSIASKASNSNTLMAVLGFPIILPLLLLLIKVSKYAMDGIARTSGIDEIVTLIAIIVITITTSILLFPYLWRSN